MHGVSHLSCFRSLEIKVCIWTIWWAPFSRRAAMAHGDKPGKFRAVACSETDFGETIAFLVAWFQHNTPMDSWFLLSFDPVWPRKELCLEDNKIQQVTYPLFKSLNLCGKWLTQLTGQVALWSHFLEVRPQGDDVLVVAGRGWSCLPSMHNSLCRIASFRNGLRCRPRMSTDDIYNFCP